MSKAQRDLKNASIVMDDCEVEGTIHIPPGGRVSDFLQVDRDFIAVTNAKVTTSRSVYTSDVVMVNRNLVKVLVLTEQ